MRSAESRIRRLFDSSAAVLRRVNASIRSGGTLGSAARAERARKPGAIPEDQLVALSALDHAHPAIFQEHADLAPLKAHLGEVPLPRECSRLRQRLLSDPRLDDYLPIFRSMASGVKIRR